MKDLRIEVTDKGTALYLATDPDGVWAKTTRPGDLVTIDWDAQGRVIGVEAIGSAARNAISAVVTELKQAPAADSDALRGALDAITGETEVQPSSFEAEFTQLVREVKPEALHVALDSVVRNSYHGVKSTFALFKALAIEYATGPVTARSRVTSGHELPRDAAAAVEEIFLATGNKANVPMTQQAKTKTLTSIGRQARPDKHIETQGATIKQASSAAKSFAIDSAAAKVAKGPQGTKRTKKS